MYDPSEVALYSRVTKVALLGNGFPGGGWTAAIAAFALLVAVANPAVAADRGHDLPSGSEVPYGWWTRGGQVHAAGSIG
jgi:hypothetical protein